MKAKPAETGSLKTRTRSDADRSSITLKNRSTGTQQDEFSPIVKGERFYLREVRLSDVNERYYRWMNDPEIVQFLESRFVPRSMESLAAYVRHMDGNSDELFFAICAIDGDEHVGNIKIGPINWYHRRADIGLLIGEKKYWGKGCATEAIALATKFAFETLSLNKMKAGCYEMNKGSERAFEKCGWQQEALLRDECLMDGRPVNVICMGITAADYREKVAK
ncbi:MAG: GNAT family N-acetyltransferase [candidate division Zixibacteria bacterium]|nr:GNAT family N-acetyltransferase [candidate division Zixibacteria bacterium]